MLVLALLFAIRGSTVAGAGGSTASAGSSTTVVSGAGRSTSVSPASLSPIRIVGAGRESPLQSL